jgi:flagellar biosynthetic protein FlhB
MDRTEKPTPKKLDDARKKGQVAQSREVPSVMILFSALGFFYFAGAYMFQQMCGLIGESYRQMNDAVLHDIASAGAFARWSFEQALLIMLPVMLVIAAIGVAANVAQIGFLFKEDVLALNLAKLNPLSGLKRLVSLRSLVELVKSIVKILFVGTIAYLILKRELDTIPSLVQADVWDIVRFAGQAGFKITFFVCLGLVLIAGLDLAYQRWQHEKELRMTKQEVKDEHKQTEGDPKIKARIRSMQIEMAHRRMMDMVPQADVVITNPTHFAVAIQFDPNVMSAPKVVAKGADHMAQRIRETALRHDVPLVENQPLARALYRTTELDAFIPVELYRAVAEVLAYVYRLKGVKP